MTDHHSLPENSQADSLTKRLIVGVVLVNLFIYFLTGVFLYQSRINLEKQYEIRTQNMAQVFDDNISGSIDKINISLFAVKGEVEEQLAGGGIQGKKLNRFIESYFSLLPQLESIRVADAEGEVLYGIGVLKRVNIIDRDYFIQLRDNADKGLVFAKPVESRMSGKWVLNIARRLNREDGSFAGVVFGQLAIDTFTDSFSKVQIGKHGSVALRNAEYEIIARYPDNQLTSEVKRKQISRPFKELLESGRNQATYKAHYPLDNIERIYTFHRIGEYPLIVNVGMATGEYIKTWRKEAAMNSLLLLIFTAVSSAFSRAMIIRWRSEKLVQEALRKSNETLEQRILERTNELSLANEQLTTELTERKRGEEARRNLERKLQQAQKAESLGRMAGAIAHNFNNMLAAVLGNLELAMEDLPQDTMPFGNLATAKKAANQAANVSRLMLTYLGQLPGKREPLDLSAACRRSQPLLTASIPEKVSLKVDLPTAGPIIKANEHQISQILTNLVTNAWEAIGENGGNILLAVRTVTHTDIEATYSLPAEWQPQAGLYACLEVADDGHGIQDENFSKLFDPFFTTKFTGRGLGLPVVLGIVRAHHGGITIESKASGGIIFRIFFPVSTATAVPLPEKSDTVPEFFGASTLLLVEDEAPVREMAKAMLIKLGFTVHEARDGAEALEVFRQHQDTIRIVLSDLTMPGMDGWETLAALRQLQPDIRVILASGYNQDQVMAGDHPVRLHAFLGKPYSINGLREAISKALSVKIEGVAV